MVTILDIDVISFLGMSETLNIGIARATFERFSI
jgi:hypothetical protein